MRRRGGRGGRGRGGASRLLDRLKEQRTLDLRDLRALERPPGMPDRVELAEARWGGELPVAIAIASSDGEDLVGWAQLATLLVGSEAGVGETLVFAPGFTPWTRGWAARVAETGTHLRLLTLPALAPSPDEIHDQEVLPPPSGAVRLGGAGASLVERMARVIEGAATISEVGALRRTAGAWVCYLGGKLVLRLVPEREGAVVYLLDPERREVHVNPGNFARWAAELHASVLEIARDTRDGDAPIVRQIAAAVPARMTARWLPWKPDGSDPIDWAGVDTEGRPVVGLVRAAAGLTDFVGLLCALERVIEDPEEWGVGASAFPRVILTASQVEPRVRAFLDALEIDFDVVDAERAGNGAARERRGRRRGRRRRRGRGDEAGWTSEVGEADPSSVPGLDGIEEAELEEFAEADGREEEPDAREVRAAAPKVRDAAPEGRERAPEGSDTPREAFEPGEEALEVERGPLAEEAAEPPATAAATDEDAGDRLSQEVEATLAEEPGAPDEEGAEPLEEAPRRPRRPRAALVVRDEEEAILAGLVLARERRNVVLFWVCPQEGLMDFFKGRATDLADNVDLLLVGFTAQPIPLEIINTAELYRGRLQWFDHHEWPIEDLERLRESIGRDAIVFVPGGGASSLAAVQQVTERRSRFTDKLVEYSGRRLSENDMGKWGYRLAGLLRRLCETPGDHRAEVQPVLAGKATELPEAEGVFEAETRWVEEKDPRLVFFGEYSLVVVQVPEPLDPGEVARRLRLKTGARLSLASREGDELVTLAANEEKRHINVMGLIDQLAARISWLHARPSGDRVGRVIIEDLARHPERFEFLIGEVVRHKSVLYG